MLRAHTHTHQMFVYKTHTCTCSVLTTQCFFIVVFVLLAATLCFCRLGYSDFLFAQTASDVSVRVSVLAHSCVCGKIVSLVAPTRSALFRSLLRTFDKIVLHMHTYTCTYVCTYACVCIKIYIFKYVSFLYSILFSFHFAVCFFMCQYQYIGSAKITLAFLALSVATVSTFAVCRSFFLFCSYRSLNHSLSLSVSAFASGTCSARSIPSHMNASAFVGVSAFQFVVDSLCVWTRCECVSCSVFSLLLNGCVCFEYLNTS